MKLFLYRTLDNDEDGDPIDFGAVKAMGIELAADIVRRHVKGLILSDEVEKIRIYPTEDRNTAGILKEGKEPFQDFDM